MIKTAKKLACFAILFFVFINLSYGSDYYVDANLGNDSYNGTKEFPWQNIAKSFLRLTPGDTVYCTGNFGQILIGNSVPLGTSDKHIVFTRWPDKPIPEAQWVRWEYSSEQDVYHEFVEWNIEVGPIADGDGALDTNNAVYFKNSSYIWIKDCKIRGATVDWAPLEDSDFAPYIWHGNPACSGAKETRCENITFENCDFKYGSESIKVWETTGSKRFWTIKDCVFEKTGGDYILFTGNNDDLQALVKNCLFLPQVQYDHYFHWGGTAVGNWAGKEGQKVTQDSGASGVFWKIYGGRIYIWADDENHKPIRSNATTWRLDSDPDNVYFVPSGTGDNVHNDHIAMEEAGGITLDGCEFRGGPNDMQIIKIAALDYRNGTPLDVVPTNIVVKNCNWHSPAATTWMIRLFDFKDVYFINNTGDGDSTGVSGGTCKRFALRVDKDAYYDLHLYNNLLSGISVAEGVDSIVSHNNMIEYAYLPPELDDKGDNIIGVNFDQGMFIERGGNYQLVAGADAIDNGSDLIPVETDKKNNNRPSGGKYDIGCYEYIYDVTAPEIPDNLSAEAINESTIRVSWHESSDQESDILCYNVYRGGEYVGKTEETSYDDSGLLADHTYTYTVSCVNVDLVESDQSDSVSATTDPDVVSPIVLSVFCDNSNQVRVTFNENLLETSAEDKSNYSIVNDVTVLNASLGSDSKTVLLTTSDHLEGVYELAVVGIKDLSGNSVVPTSKQYENYNVVLHMPCDNDIQNDSSFGNLAGYWVNTPSYVQGRSGMSINTSSGAYVMIPHNVCLDGYENLTLAVWAKKNQADVGGNLIYKHITYNLKINGTYFNGAIFDENGGRHDFLFNTGAMNDTEWHHYSIVYNGERIYGYLDGEFVGAVVSSGGVDTSPERDVYIGKDPWGSSFPGLIDEVRIYKKALKAEEIETLHNSAPIIFPASFDLQSIYSDQLLELNLTAVDPEGDTFTFVAETFPAGATFSDGLFRWVPTDAQLGDHDVLFVARDSNGASSQVPVTIRVLEDIPANVPPVANAGSDQVVNDTNRSGAENVTFNGSGSSDSDGTIINYDWSIDGQSIGQGQTFTTGLQVGSHTVTLTVTDNNGAFRTDTVTVIVNLPPVANAGSDISVIDEDKSGNESVRLDGSNSSDSDGNLTSYVWVIDNGSPVGGSSPSVNLSVGSHSAVLTVTDNRGAVSSDTVVITVSAPANEEPTAHAGNDVSVTDADGNGSESVTLSGSGSDSDGTISSYVWTEGGATLGSGSSLNTSFTVGVHTVTLTVTDNDGATDTDTVVVTVNEKPNEGPTANAGSDISVTDNDDTGSESVTLNGSASSDDDGAISSYVWTEGGTTLGSGSSLNTSFTVGVHTVTLTVTDNDGATDTDTVVVTVNEKPNEGPTANAGSDISVTDNDGTGSESVTLNGSASSDDDGTISSYVWTEGGATLGSGSSLNTSFTVGVHTVTLTVTDNDGATDIDTVVVTVNEKPNEGPTANAGSNVAVTDNDGSGSESVTLNGTASLDDDGTISSYVWTEGGATLGSGSSLNASFTVGVHTVTLTVTDNDGATDIDTVVVTVNEKPNEGPTANAGSDITVTDNDDTGSESVTLNGSSSSDDDGTISSYVWTESGATLGSGASLNTSFAVGFHVITLTVTDNDGATDTDLVVVIVNEKPNEKPTAQAGSDITVIDNDDTGSELVALNGSASSDSDGTISSYIWSENQTFIGSGSTLSHTFTVGTHVVTLTVIDNDGDLDSDTIVVVVNEPENESPAANAGSDITVIDTDDNGFESITLDGSNSSDPDGTITSYIWREGGSLVGIGQSITKVLTVGVHTITLTVTDDDGATATDTLVVRIDEPENQAPTANAGSDKSVVDTDRNGRENVTMSAAASSDPDGSISSYQWVEDETFLGSSSTLSMDFTVGVHIVTLTVTDNDGASSSDSITVTVSEPANVSPVASAGSDITVSDTNRDGSESVTLNASASSDTDGELVSYFWSEGATILGEGITLNKTFALGVHQITLTVMDDDDSTSTDTLTVTVNELPNEAPVANAGADQTVIDNSDKGLKEITLSAAGSSDVDGSIVSYEWTENSVVLGTSSSITVDMNVGVHQIILTVTDDDGASSTDTVIVTVNSPENVVPVADAGDDQVLIDNDDNGVEQVALSAAGSSDSDGTIVSYIWSLAGETIGSEEHVNVSLGVGVHTITLVVMDDDGATASDTVQIEVKAHVNEVPVANAGADQQVTDEDQTGAELVMLSAAASVDHDGTIESYLWTSNGQTLGSSETLSYSFNVGVHHVILTVTDDDGATNSDDVIVTVLEKDITHYTVSVNVSGYGQISPSGDIVVEEGGDLNFVITPDEGYDVFKIKVDNVNMAVANTLSLDDIQDNHVVSVVFVQDKDSNDRTAPEIASSTPRADSIQVPQNTVVVLTLSDDGSGIDDGTVEIRLEGDVIYSGNQDVYESDCGSCRRTGTVNSYTYTYQPTELFDYDQTINLEVSATDMVGNVLDGASYSFKTQMRSFGGTAMVHDAADILLKENPTSVQDSAGTVYVAWQGGDAGSRDIYLSRLANNPLQLIDTVIVAENASDQYNPVLAIDGDDRLYIVWQDNRRGNWDIYLATSADGVEWSDPARINDSDNNAIEPVMVVERTAPYRVHVSWQDYRNGNSDIYYAVSGDQFATVTNQQITTSTRRDSQPNLAVTNDGNAYLVWTAENNGGATNIEGAYCVNTTWSYGTVTFRPGNQHSAVVATEEVGSIAHLLWISDENGDDDVFYDTMNGLPGSPLDGVVIADDSSESNQISPALAVRGSTGNGLKLYACWQDERNIIENNNDTDIYFAESDDVFGVNSWITEDDTTSSSQTHPVLGMNAAGNPYVVWVDGRNGGADIYYTGTTSINSHVYASQVVPVSLGGTIGVPLEEIDSVDDVSIQVPAGAFWDDVTITISKIENAPVPANMSPTDVIASYEFGPSSKLEFAKPVTITIPYEVSEFGDETAYWYNPDSGDLSQSGISNIEHIVISPTLHAIRYTTTHFTQYVIARPAEIDDSATGSSGGSGGGCAMARYGDTPGDAISFVLPYVLLFGIIYAIKLYDRKRKVRVPVRIRTKRN